MKNIKIPFDWFLFKTLTTVCCLPHPIISHKWSHERTHVLCFTMLLWILWQVLKNTVLSLLRPFTFCNSFKNGSHVAKLWCAQGQGLLVSDSLWLKRHFYFWKVRRVPKRFCVEGKCNRNDDAGKSVKWYIFACVWGAWSYRT